MSWLNDNLCRVVASFIALALCVALIVICSQDTIYSEEAFRGWSKQTGNLRKLTYEEWRALMKVTENNKRKVPMIP